MGNCCVKKSTRGDLRSDITESRYDSYGLLSSDIIESDIRLDDAQKEKFLCHLTELPFNQCNCDICLHAFPPMSISGRPIEFVVDGERLYVKYRGIDMEPEDITEDRDITCQRGPVLRKVLFNGVQYSFC